MPQVELSGAFASAGQSLLMPSHTSAASQPSAATRQTVFAGLTASVGQSSELPLQSSARSQPPFAARQTVPAAAGLKPQTPAGLHVRSARQVPGAAVGQSVGVRQATQVPPTQ